MEELRDDGRDPAEVTRPARALEPLAERARVDRRPAARRPDTSPRRRREDDVDAEPAGDREVARLVARIRGEVLAGSANCSGFTKIDTTTKSRSARARRISEAWPSWSAPIVGTRPTVRPSARAASAAAKRRRDRRGSPPARRAPPRRPRGPRAGGGRRARASSSARSARADVGRTASGARGAPAPRGCAATVPASPRTAGPVSASAGPTRCDVRERGRLQRREHARRIGDAGQRARAPRRARVTVTR